MEEKKHVGRPTNEEVASRKKKKVIKYSLITIVSILLVGGIALFLNRDNIDFSSLMGASIFKRENYVVNYRYDTKDCHSIYSNETDLESFSRCKTSNSKIATCEVVSGSFTGYPDQINIYAKKKGNVTIKIYGRDKNNKEKVLTKRFKVRNDFTAPTCKFSTIKDVKFNSDITVTVNCNENVTPTNFLITGTKTDSKYGKVNAITYYNLIPVTFDKSEYYIKQPKIKKINNKSYKITFSIPKDLRYSYHNADIKFYRGLFMDSSGNVTTIHHNSNQFEVRN